MTLDVFVFVLIVNAHNRTGKGKDFAHCHIFRSISVHYGNSFSYFCTGNIIYTSTRMAGTVKDMSLIKQVLQLKQLGESNRGVSRKLKINKETVNNYIRMVKDNG